jgi:ABC-type sugar transport system ATPase subunit
VTIEPMSADAGAPVAARLRGVSKNFGGTEALLAVDLTIRGGEVLALLGENGAGKSTLVKVLTGVIAPDSGTIEIDGVVSDALTPRRAEDLGVARVAQELSLFPEMDVAANVLIGREPRRFGLVDRRALRSRTSEFLELLGVPIDVRLPVRHLSLAERQLVEIAKAMARTPRILVLDEPTSGLREHEVQRLFEVIGRLRDQGRAIVFISHRLDEVFAIADRIAVLKDGRNSGFVDRADAVHDDIVRMMVGREVDSQFPARSPAVRHEGRAAALRAVGFGVPGTPVTGIDLEVYPGEICGLAGLQGQGQTILLEGLFGLRRATGRLDIGTRRGPFRHPGAAVDAGLALVPEDRKSEGGHLDFTVRANVTLPTLDRFTRGTVIQRKVERRRARTATAALGVRPANPEHVMANLSGGNQQKVILARWLEAGPTVLLLADPTRGVDIATKQEIYRIIRAEANKGVAVLFLSTELPELLGLCDRVLVMVDGSIAADFDGEHVSEEAVMAVAAGAASER